jgi:hypothetical protein
MPERRPSNSELRLRKLAEDDPAAKERGILELFDEVAEEPADEDAPLARDVDETRSE